MNTQRRIFRGRGGPKDRRLPKYNARRRKQPGASTQGDSRTANINNRDGLHNEENSDSSSESDEVDVEIIQEHPIDRPPQQNPIILSPETTNADDRPWLKEIKHLERRIQNVQESIQLGTEGIANPTIYRENVLNAVDNCVNEWRAIITHYKDDMDSQTIRAPSLLVFGLLQLALQSGPLAGGKPGYFKRCGSAVAKDVLQFLQDVVPDSEPYSTLGFSQKQADAIEIWRINAQKAVESDKPPSKSAIKKQDGKSKKKKNKKTG